MHLRVLKLVYIYNEPLHVSVSHVACTILQHSVYHTCMCFNMHKFCKLPSARVSHESKNKRMFL
jgi:hypothetical protein